MIAAIARAADVPVAVAGEKIPLAGFAQFTLVGALLGIGLAKILSTRARHPRNSFIRATTALTALSVVPDFAIDATTATKLVLISTHVAAAAVIIPAIAHRLND